MKIFSFIITKLRMDRCSCVCHFAALEDLNFLPTQIPTKECIKGSLVRFDIKGSHSHKIINYSQVD